ncbi:cell wall-binding repeat-containing protein [Bifidobacterium panos]|nr:cell wall-binding repeat-containing protein [Bifidobacterium sp. DSM 109963]
MADSTTGRTATVTSGDQFLQALNDASVSEILVSGDVTVQPNVQQSGASIPVYFGSSKTISAASSGGTLYFRGPIELGADVTFKDIVVRFISAAGLGGVAQREIFLNGHKLVLNDVDSFYECSADLGDFGCNAGDMLLPTVLGGSSAYWRNQGKSQGPRAELEITKPNSDTALQAVKMGVGENSNTAYTGSSRVSVSPSVQLYDGIDVSGTAASQVVLNATSLSSSSKFGPVRGGANSTLTLANPSNISNPAFEIAVSGFADTFVSGNVTFKPKTGSELKNLSLPAGNTLNLGAGSGDGIGQLTIDGDLTGGGTVYLRAADGKMSIAGSVSGKPLVKSMFGSLRSGYAYITAAKPSAGAFSTELSDFVWSKESDGTWMLRASNSWTVKPAIAGWDEDKTPSVPQGSAQYGDVTFTYKPASGGAFSSDKPTKPGDYVMRAAVEAGETDDGIYYTALSDEVSFTITATKPEPEPEPAPVKVKPPVAKSGLVYNGKAQTGVNGATGYTLSGQTTGTNAGSYTATATLAKGYVWSDGSSGVKKITWSIAKAKPSYTTPSNLSGVQGSKLSSVKLPSGWAWKAPSTVLSKTGKQQYDAVYTPKDTGNYTTVAQKLTVNVTAKPTPAPVKVKPPTAKSGLVYNGKSQTGVNGATGYTLSGQTGTNAGSYTATATLAKGYVWSDGSSGVKKIGWSIGKAKPSYSTPSNLSGVQGGKLSGVKLPSGWAWKNSNTTLSKMGKQQYDAVYTPGDTRNYTTVAQKLTVNVTAKSSQSQLQRLAGDTRYDTMARLVATAFPKTSGTVVVANGGNYPDALSASGLAGVLGAPIVLTDSGSLSDQAAAQLKRLRPSRIVVAGGTSAVSSRVESQLRGYAKNVERQAGSTRYDTSYKLYTRGGKSWGTTAIVATGAHYADALSISSYAYAMKAPVFLCDPSSGLTSQQKSALKKFKRVVVVGGEQAVPSRLVKGLPGLVRLSGNTRYDTSVSIAKWVQKNGLGMNGVVYATGEHFADALAAGPLAGRNKAAMLLVADPNSATVSYSASYRGKLTKAYVAGGPNAVSAATANAIADKLNMKQP